MKFLLYYTVDAAHEEMEVQWRKTLLRLGMASSGDDDGSGSSAYEAAVALLQIHRKGRPPWIEEEAEAIRRFFTLLA
jgi:hypothetical protein